MKLHKLSIVLFLVSSLLAEQKDMLHLLNDLNEASDLATKTKLNINQTPSIVSILHADELKKLGIVNLYKALETVPGIEISMGIGGGKQINMRGNKSIVTDKVKLMIDGVSVNNELIGSSFFYLDMPIENIQRIEIIRGPASALYGSFANIGVINVITKASTHKKGTVFLNTSSEGFSNVGFTQHLNSKNLKVGIDGHFVHNKNSREYSHYSLIPTNDTYSSYENAINKSLGLYVQAPQDFSLQMKFLQRTAQNYYGYGAWPIVQDPKALTHTSYFSEFKYAPKLSQDASLEFKAGYKQYKLVGFSRLVPYSKIAPPSYDLIGDGYYKEEKLYSDLVLHYEYQNHQLLFGTYYSYAKESQTSYYYNNRAVSEEPTILKNGIAEHISRRNYAFYFNDIYTLSNSVRANIGLRYDHYSDADSGYSPKLALLYNYDEKQNYKLIFQHSFRVPSWIETYGTNQPFIGSETLKSESVNTVEFAYRYQNSLQSWFNINFFYSNMNHFIYRAPDYTLQNGKDTYSYGSEVEIKIPIDENGHMQANYSYVNMKDKHNQEVPFIANNLANLMFWYNFTTSFATASKVHYSGEKKREKQDTRDTLASYTTFDQTLSYNYGAFLFQASVKNLFDEHVSFPSPLGNEVTSGTYKDDFARDGRTFWLSLEWRGE